MHTFYFIALSLYFQPILRITWKVSYIEIETSISYLGMAECNYSIALDESKGRVLVAKKSIPQGELILHEKPLGKK